MDIQPFSIDIEIPNNIEFYKPIEGGHAHFTDQPCVSSTQPIQNRTSAYFRELEDLIEQQIEIVRPTDKCDVLIGYDDILSDIYMSVLTQHQCFVQNLKPTAVENYLLFGLPGSGKTTLLKVAAVNCAKLLKSNITLLNVMGSTLQSKWVGESMKLVEILYSVADRHAPTILTFDEIDALCRKRTQNEDDHVRSFKGTLLAAMQGLKSHPRVVTIASTNKPYDLDSGFLRRFPNKFHINLPTPLQRIAIAKMAIEKTTRKSIDALMFLILDEKKIVLETEGYTGDDIVTAVQKAVKYITLFYYDGESLTRNQFNRRLADIQNGSTVPTTKMLELTMDILVKEGFQTVSPSYDEDEQEKVEIFATNARCTRHEQISTITSTARQNVSWSPFRLVAKNTNR